MTGTTIAAAPSAFETARLRFQAKDWTGCLAAAEEALANAGGRTRINALSLKARVLALHLGRRREGLAMIEEALGLAPDNAAVLEAAAKLRLADGRAASAFGIYKRLWRADASSVVALRGLFDILMDRMRYAAARRLAPVLEAAQGLTPALVPDLVEIALVYRDEAAASAVLKRAPPTVPSPKLARYERALRSLQAERAAGDTMAGYHHIGVAGVAFTGSTTFGVILGSMPGYAFAGETQWLTNVRNAGGAMETIRGTSTPPGKWPVACRVCLRDCQCFDVAFRTGLAADETGWYAKIADRLGVKNIITADKNLHLYWELDPLFRFDYVILYKSPSQYLRSHLKQHLRRGEAAASLDRDWVSANLHRWAYNYLGHMKAIRPTGRRVVLNWEEFVAAPAPHMRRLSSLLSIPLPPETLDAIRLGHFIGGNTGVDVDALKSDPRLVLRPSNAPPLPPDLEAAAVDHPEAQRVARMLDNEYRRQFVAGED
jgi:tetratricopeptide (TPR) repeat protein